MRSRVFLKLVGVFLLVIAVTTAILDLRVRRAWVRSQTEEITESLTRKTQLVALRVENDKSAPVKELAVQESKAANARVTVIDASGKVLADSEAQAESMENHATRPEFQAALRGQVGSAIRSSRTVGIEFLYVAVSIKGGAVRLAYPLSSIQQNLGAIRRHLLIATLWASLASLLLAQYVGMYDSNVFQFVADLARQLAVRHYAAI